MKYGVVRKSCRNFCLKQNLPCKGWRIQPTGKYAATFFSNNISVVSLNENLSAVKLVENISSNTSFIIKNSFDPIQRVEKHLKSWIHAHSYGVLFGEKDILECAFHNKSSSTGPYSLPLVAYGGYSWKVDEFSGSDVNPLRPRGSRKCKWDESSARANHCSLTLETRSMYINIAKVVLREWNFTVDTVF